MQQFQTDFIAKIVPASIASQKATRVPAAITMAQAILESGWGQTRLAITCLNYFGIKANHLQIAEGHYKEWNTQEEVGKTLEHIQSNFATYDSIEECFTAHSNLLLTPHYAAAMAVADNIDEFAWQLGPILPGHPTACDYSTLTQYHDRLMAIIRDYRLDSYSV